MKDSVAPLGKLEITSNEKSKPKPLEIVSLEERKTLEPHCKTSVYRKMAAAPRAPMKRPAGAAVGIMAKPSESDSEGWVASSAAEEADSEISLMVAERESDASEMALEASSRMELATELADSVASLAPEVTDSIAEDASPMISEVIDPTGPSWA